MNWNPLESIATIDKIKQLSFCLWIFSFCRPVWQPWELLLQACWQVQLLARQQERQPAKQQVQQEQRVL
jgi:hypothetical protein